MPHTQLLELTPRPHTLHHVEVPAMRELTRLADDEIRQLLSTHRNGMGEIFRRCALGILMSGERIDSTAKLLQMYPDFRTGLEQNEQGIKFIIEEAPESAFLDRPDRSERILYPSSVKHLCSAVRDLLRQIILFKGLQTPESITTGIFKMLREAGFFTQQAVDDDNNPIEMARVVCQGGHAISNEEYAYTKRVGEELALLLIELITGCGPGAMRGPMSGAIGAYHDLKIHHARYFGFTAPGIITSEPPNKFVDPLIIFPDIEKRLEAFIRASLGCVVFPGGPGTAEEIQTILSILMHPENNNAQYPIIFTGPTSSEPYIHATETFLKNTIGEEALGTFEIVIDNPTLVAQKLMLKIVKAKELRRAQGDTNMWYRKLHWPKELQEPFEATHETMSELNLAKDQPAYQLAANLRRAFSGIVKGNVTAEGVELVRNNPFIIRGDEVITKEMDTFLRRMVEEGRMRLDGDYAPCYKLESKSLPKQRKKMGSRKRTK